MSTRSPRSATSALRLLLLAMLGPGGCGPVARGPADAAGHDGGHDGGDGESCGPCGCQPVEGMTCVPAGPFLMGRAGPDVFEEAPLHLVTLSSFLIDLHEVTNREYAACVDAGACAPPASPSSVTRASYFGISAYADHPVVNVNWAMAAEYCAFAGGRLPTEAEWEKAARGGCEARGDPALCEEDLDAPPYPWGAEDPDCARANVSSCSPDTTRVGASPSGQSAYGLFDTIGNASEWVHDWFWGEYYEVGPATDPQGPSEERALGACGGETGRAVRGGSFATSPVRSLPVRGCMHPGTTDPTRSFRCARDSG